MDMCTQICKGKPRQRVERVLAEPLTAPCADGFCWTQSPGWDLPGDAREGPLERDQLPPVSFQ